ncbi:FMN-binding protein MioC [Gallaecimonas sp. GXIMD4217]|uniref:FMN-binding protein MioC n=1 Tax=Gallaecimonas sp. GXIMD4217 TaxID=3131927 RepID=UPI00311ACF01
MLGAAEYVADALADLLKAQGHDPQIHLEPTLAQLPREGTWLICTSTHGAGELPDNIQPFSEQLASQPDLGLVRFAVFALGDSSYDTFCQGGKTLEQQLLACQAKPLWPRLDIDVQDPALPEETAEAWLKDHLDRI